VPARYDTFLAYLGILVSLQNKLDELAGALIALSFCYWEVGGPFLVLVMMRVYRERRSGVFAGIIMAGIILLAVSLLLYPDGVIPFFRASVNTCAMNMA